MDTTADPCEDFYQFACGGYLEATVIPEDRSRTSMFSEVGDKLNQQLKGRAVSDDMLEEGGP